MTIIQILFIIAGLVMIISSFMQLQREKLTLHQAIMWWIVWIGVICISIFSQYVLQFIKYLGLSNPIDSIVYISILVIFIILYRQQIKQELLNRQITRIIREQSILHVKDQRVKRKS